MEVVLYNYNYSDPLEAMERFVESVHDQALCYTSLDLIKSGITQQEDIEAAVHRAINIYRLAGLDLEGNFKLIYLAGHSGLVPLWELSEAAFKLTLFKADVQSKRTARIQMEFIQSLIDDDAYQSLRNCH